MLKTDAILMNDNIREMRMFGGGKGGGSQAGREAERWVGWAGGR